MKQGGIGMFVDRDTGKTAWLWKVVPRDAVAASVEYYDMMTGDKWSVCDVTDCADNVFQKRWVILRELTPEEALKAITFTPSQHIEKVELEAKCVGLRHDIKSLEGKIEFKCKELDAFRREADSLREQLWSTLQELKRFDTEGA